MKILKFGGTSVANAERLETVFQIIKTAEKNSGKVAVVVSAFGGMTDRLIETGQKAAVGDEGYITFLDEMKKRHHDAVKTLIVATKRKSVNEYVKTTFTELADLLHGVFLLRELSDRTLDMVMSFGERLCAFILASYASSKRVPAEFIDTRTQVKTDNHFGSAVVDFKKTNANIRKHFSNSNKLNIVTGFLGSTKNGETTTLGRGGSDFTAAIYGAALKAKEIEIWTDVDGVLTADPRKVKKAFSLDRLSYEEAMELSHFGAKVIYPPTLQPAFDNNITVRIRNTFNTGFPGTVISKSATSSHLTVKGISSIDKVSLLRVEGSGMVGVVGTSGRLFNALANQKINIIMITQGSSEHSICMVVKPSDGIKAREVIEQEFALEIAAHYIDPVVVETGYSVVAAIGENMQHIPVISKKF